MRCKWSFTSGNILDIQCDVLICSANPQLNLSGGVGGQLLKQYGKSMQQELRDYLKQSGKNYIREGEIACIFPKQSSYRMIIHAVAINVFYESSIETVTQVIDKALQAIEHHKFKSASLTALATGYGNLTIKDFSSALKPLFSKSYKLDEITVCVKKQEDLVVILHNIKE